MKLKNNIICITLIFLLFIFTIFTEIYLKKTNAMNFNKYDDYTTIEIINNNNLKLKTNEKIKLNIKINDILKTSNKIFNWKSTNPNVAEVNYNGIVTTKKPGTTTIICQSENETIKTQITVYDQKKIIIIVGDSRMDHFKDDNEFTETSKYEVKYTEQKKFSTHFERIYVVSLSGMRYEWIAKTGKYEKENATNYVQEIIKEYEEKTTEITKYEIKILFNLGVNDLTEKQLKDTTPSEYAEKYLKTLNKNLSNEWSSNIISKISLNMITLFPTNDEQIQYHFPGRHNKDVIEFNKYIKENYKETICDAYNDLNFTENVFRERETNNKNASKRDGLHFSESFNKEELYSYLINYCANQ